MLGTALFHLTVIESPVFELGCCHCVVFIRIVITRLAKLSHFTEYEVRKVRKKQ